MEKPLVAEGDDAVGAPLDLGERHLGRGSIVGHKDNRGGIALGLGEGQ